MLSMLFTVSDQKHHFPLTLDPLPCSVLILSMAKNQSDVENLVKNCLNDYNNIHLLTCFKTNGKNKTITRNVYRKEKPVVQLSLISYSLHLAGGFLEVY